MRTRLWLQLTAIGLACSCAPTPRAATSRSIGSPLGWEPAPGQLEERRVRLRGVEDRPRRAILFRPSGWSPDREWPFLLAFPGSGGNPDDWVRYPRFLELADRHGFVVAILDVPGVGRRVPDPVRAALAVYVESVIATAHGELAATGEQWLIGGSAGGAGAWIWALRDPEAWKGWISISPAGVPSGEQLAQLAEHRVMVVQGLADTAVYVPHTRKLVRRLREARMESCSVLLEHAGHSLHSWPVMEMVFDFVTTGDCAWPRDRPSSLSTERGSGHDDG